MHGLMTHRPLRVIDILSHAARVHADQGIVSAPVEGDIHRQTDPDTLARLAQLAHALGGLGVVAGDRIGALAWNGYRPSELYHKVAGIGALWPTDAPVAKVHALCEDEHVIGAPFYVMDEVAGRDFDAPILPDQDSATRHAIVDGMNRVLATIA